MAGIAILQTHLESFDRNLSIFPGKKFCARIFRITRGRRWSEIERADVTYDRSSVGTSWKRQRCSMTTRTREKDRMLFRRDFAATDRDSPRETIQKRWIFLSLLSTKLDR